MCIMSYSISGVMCVMCDVVCVVWRVVYSSDHLLYGGGYVVYHDMS